MSDAAILELKEVNLGRERRFTKHPNLRNHKVNEE